MTAPEQMLKPCPFCKSADVSMSFSATMQSPEPFSRFVECEKCCASGPARDIAAYDTDADAQAAAITAWNTRPAPAELVEALPDDISELVLRIGRAEWGQTPAHDAEGHAAHVADSVRITAEHFGQDGPQHMHGLYVAGTETVICHSGTSPNSPQIARALTGAWNRLHDLAALRNAGAAS